MSSTDDTTHPNEDSTSRADHEKELRETIIHREECAVKKAKFLVGAAFLICATAVSCAVFVFAKHSDKRRFELEYEGFTKDIRALVRWEIRYNIALMDQLSASITIAAGLRNSTFPFHTEPEFEITGGFVDGMGGIMSVAFAPLVNAEQREKWEDYSVENQRWIERSAYLEKVHPAHKDALHGTIQDHEHDRRLSEEQGETSISERIFKFSGGKKVFEYYAPNKVYAPLWHVSPANYSVVNANLLSENHIADTYSAMRKTNTTVISANTPIHDLFDFLFDPEEKQRKNDPHGFILTPVYSAFEVNPTLVGFLTAITPFGNLLDRLLPEGRHGILGVLKDGCGNVMSFEMSGGKARFLGYEDLHDPQFEVYESVELNLEMYEEMVDGLCAHDLYIYPTRELLSSHDTKNPVIYTSIVVFAFFVTAILLKVYDLLVTARQNKTMMAAVQSHSVVTSLFPKAVGKQLIQEAQPKAEKNSTDKLDHFKAPSKYDGRIGRGSKPIADLFPEATVMFADLVGFTAWSDGREPSNIFELLENIYSAFDEIAKRRRVFKIETIGDCYVAVCGLPNPNKNHHVVMARFAHECLQRIDPILHEMAPSLGGQTLDLGLRIGLHCGPVTGGVLRGDRARFQLFGDTVNTTARIETTGAKNKIHLSQQLADLLISSGKGHWVSRREDIVEAKGKGTLQTYWLKIINGDKSSHHSDYSISDDENPQLEFGSDIEKSKLEMVESSMLSFMPKSHDIPQVSDTAKSSCIDDMV